MCRDELRQLVEQMDFDTVGVWIALGWEERSRRLHLNFQETSYLNSLLSARIDTLEEHPCNTERHSTEEQARTTSER